MLKEKSLIYVLTLIFIITFGRGTSLASYNVVEINEKVIRSNFSPNGKMIAYTINKNGTKGNTSKLCIFNGKRAEALAEISSPEEKIEFLWSSDENSIAYTIKEKVYKENKLVECCSLWVAIFNENKRMLLAKAYNQNINFCWSPDGSKIAFLLQDSNIPKEENKNEYDLWIANYDGTQMKLLGSKIYKQITSYPPIINWLSESPKIAIYQSLEFESPDYEPYRLIMIDVATGKIEKIEKEIAIWGKNIDDILRILPFIHRLEDAGWNQSLSYIFTSDKGKIVFEAIENDKWSVKILKKEIIETIFISSENPLSTEFYPHFLLLSLDEKAIAYVEETEGGNRLWIMNTRGNMKRCLPKERVYNIINIDFWSNGKLYYHLLYNDKGRKFYSYDINTGRKNLILNLSRYNNIAYSPDKSKLVYTSDSSLWLLNLKTNKKEKLLKFKEPITFQYIYWAPKGDKILFNHGGKLKIISLK